MVVPIADSGFIIALNSSNAAEKRWARQHLEGSTLPFLTCEGAIIEASHFLAPSLVARMLEDGYFEIALDLASEISSIRPLLEKYSGRMDFTDACIVRMSELFPDCEVFTVDRDFDFYRRFNTKPIPAVYPPVIK